MYIVICETTYECWYNEFGSLDAALEYIKDNDYHGIYCRLFSATEYPVPVKGFER